MLSSESVDRLNSFVLGELEFSALWDWLAQAEYDEGLGADERDKLAGVRLLAIEADEGLRDVDEVKSATQSLLRMEATAAYDLRIAAVDIASSNATFTVAGTFAGRASRITDVRIEPAGVP